MIDISKEADACASWPTRERLRALKRIIPRARVEEVLAQTGHDRSHCSRLPGWFMMEGEGIRHSLGGSARDLTVAEGRLDERHQVFQVPFGSARPAP